MHVTYHFKCGIISILNFLTKQIVQGHGILYSYSLLMRSVHGFIDLLKIYFDRGRRPRLIYSYQVYKTGILRHQKAITI